MVRGFVEVGDIGNTTGSLVVGGDILSASASVGAGESTVTINFLDLGVTDYIPLLSAELISGGDAALTNDINVPLILSRDVDELVVFFEELNAVVESLRLNIAIFL